MEKSKSHEYKYFFPPSDFDAKDATEITKIVRKIFTHFLDENGYYQNIMLKNSKDVKTMLELMANAYIHATSDYFHAIQEKEYRKKKKLSFNVDNCTEEYLEDDYAILVDGLMENIQKHRSEQNKIFDEQFKKSDDCDLSYCRIILVEAMNPPTGAKLKKFFEGLVDKFYLLDIQDFKHNFILSCINSLDKKKVVDENCILNLYEEYKAALKLQPMIKEAAEAIKKAADHFEGKVNPYTVGLGLTSIEKTWLDYEHLLDRLNNADYYDSLYEKYANENRNLKLYFFIYEDHFSLVKKFLDIKISAESIIDLYNKQIKFA